MTSPTKSSGFIIRIKGADYFVSSGDREVRCSLRGRFRLGKGPEEVLPVVGDNVEFREEILRDSRGPSGLIVTIQPRNSLFARSDSSGKQKYRILGANLDFVFLVFSARQPRMNLRLLDRMLVAAECGGMEPVICVNKMDLPENADEAKKETADYRRMGYDVVFCSAISGMGLEDLRLRMEGNKSIMAGPSGTGKTSLVTALEPGIELKVRRVSSKTGKGRHTTTHFELHPLGDSGYLGDTPGIREFGIWGVSRKELAGYFRDFSEFIGGCRFSTCIHSHEPGCAVKGAVDDGSIAGERYESYLRILETLPEGRF